VVRGSDRTIGYIALQINLTMSTTTITMDPTTPGAATLSFWMKDIGINITTPPPAASSSTTIPIAGIVGAVVGAVVFIALLVIALLLFRRRRERAKGRMVDAFTFKEPANHEEPLPNEEEAPTQLPWVGLDSTQPTPIGKVESSDWPTTPWTDGVMSNTPSGSVLNKAVPSTGLVAGTKSEIGTSGQHSSGSNGLPTEIPPNIGRTISVHSSSFSAMPDYPPPIYGLEESVRQERTRPSSSSPEPVQVSRTSVTLPPLFSPELARFASANRDVINEGLEARLQAAGYLPTDDPNDLTPEEWRNEHGVTKLELNRLKNLYAR
jgi:cell division septation protein DedD